MKRKKGFLLLCVFAFSSMLYGQGIVFEEGTWDEILAKSKETDKPIFLDIYTSWCAPCKMMEKDIFPQPAVGSYFNTRYINYHLDGEKGEGPAIVKKYNIEAYPTFLFLDGDGNVIYRFMGGRDVGGLLEEAEKVDFYAKYGGWEKVEELFNSGNQSPQFMNDYYQQVEESRKPLVLNTYLKSLPDKELFNKYSNIISDISVYDTVLFNRLVDGIVKLHGTEAVADSHVPFLIQLKLSGFMNDCINRGDRDRLEELMRYKAKFGSLYTDGYVDIEMSEGRGVFFTSVDLLNLFYSFKNDDFEQFKTLLIPYLDRIMLENNPDSLWKDKEKRFQADPDFQTFLLPYYTDINTYFTYNIIKWADYYWKNSPSDKKTIARCKEWANYAFNMNPFDDRTPLLAADFLVRLKEKKNAIAILEKAITSQKRIGRESDHVIREMQLKLRDVKNDK